MLPSAMPNHRAERAELSWLCCRLITVLDIFTAIYVTALLVACLALLDDQVNWIFAFNLGIVLYLCVSASLLALMRFTSSRSLLWHSYGNERCV